MKICLINPPWRVPGGTEVHIGYPLGIAYIVSFVENNGFDVQIVDALALGFKNKYILGNGNQHVGLSYKTLKSILKSTDADVYGISSSFTAQSQVMHDVVRLVKEIDSDFPVVVGGTHPTSDPQECMADKNIDFVVQGEGELTVVELLGALDGRREIRSVKGVHYRTPHGDSTFTGTGKFMDINALPFPAYHLLPMDSYFKAVEYGLVPHSIFARKVRWADMITSRGCPYRCVFCSIHDILGRKWRARSAESVVDEI